MNREDAGRLRPVVETAPIDHSGTPPRARLFRRAADPSAGRARRARAEEGRAPSWDTFTGVAAEAARTPAAAAFAARLAIPAKQGTFPPIPDKSVDSRGRAVIVPRLQNGAKPGARGTEPGRNDGPEAAPAPD